MPDTAVALMAKFPDVGKVKTRLAREVGNEAALDIYNRLLANAEHILNRLDKGRYLTSVFVAPAEQTNEFKKLFPEIDLHFPQKGDDLGLRMLDAIKVLLSQDNIKHAMLIGADIPEISIEIFDKGRELLNDHDIVLGPTIDGGYYLIGMSKAISSLFKGPVWGTNSVLEQTCQIARENGLSVHLLPILHDLDNKSDLKYFKDYLR